MFDKIRLNLQEFQIMDNAKLQVVQHTDIESKLPIFQYPLWENEKLQPIYGKSAFYNDPKKNFNVDIFYKDNRSILMVQLSLPKFDQPLNVTPLSLDQTVNVFKQLQERLFAIGIQTKIWSSKVALLELFKNVALNYPFTEYLELFRYMDMNRMREWEYPTTYYWMNKSHGIKIYDKVKEMQDKNKLTSHLPASVVRVEWTLKKNANIASKLNIVTLKNLLDNWDLVNDKFHQLLETLFSHEEKLQPDIHIPALKSLFMNYLKSNPRNATSNFIRDLAFCALAKSPDYEVVREVVGGEGKQKLYRFDKNVKKALLNNFLTQENNGHFGQELYNELKTKIINNPQMKGDTMYTPKSKRLLDVKNAADYLSISRSKLYQWVKTGKIPSVQIDSRRLFDVDDLDAFITKLKEVDISRMN